MTAGERFAAKARAYQVGFSGPDLSEQQSFLLAALADFRRYCGAAPDQEIFVEDDPSGRVSAYNEGFRQAYLYLERILGLDADAVNREAARLDALEAQHIENEIDNEVRRSPRYAA